LRSRSDRSSSPLAKVSKPNGAMASRNRSAQADVAVSRLSVRLKLKAAVSDGCGIARTDPLYLIVADPSRSRLRRHDSEASFSPHRRVALAKKRAGLD
jgi:hypothetical protein